MQKCWTIELSDYKAVGLSIRTRLHTYCVLLQVLVPTGSVAIIKHIRTWITCRSFLYLLLMHEKWIYMYLQNMNTIHGSLKFLWTYLSCQSSSISLPLLDPSLWSPPPSCDASPPSSSLSLSTILAFFFLGPFSSSESYKGKKTISYFYPVCPQ